MPTRVASDSGPIARSGDLLLIHISAILDRQLGLRDGTPRRVPHEPAGVNRHRVVLALVGGQTRGRYSWARLGG